MKLKFTIPLMVIVGISGCATPTTTLKNNSTGQVVRCGGDVSASAAGGLIGYSIQKNSDESCVHDYEAQGFKRIN